MTQYEPSGMAGAGSPPAATGWERDRDRLLAAAASPDCAATLAFAGVIARAPLRPAPYAIPIAGVAPEAFERLLASRFPGLDAAAARTMASSIPSKPPSDSTLDEFDDLARLLLDHRSVAGETSALLAWAIATASMAPDHLWQDMGLPSRGVLNRLLAEHFTTLHVQNVGDMKWKKFFYRQLCEREQVSICRSPSCSTCSDYSHCFGPEDRPEPGWLPMRMQARY